MGGQFLKVCVNRLMNEKHTPDSRFTLAHLWYVVALTQPYPRPLMKLSPPDSGLHRLPRPALNHLDGKVKDKLFVGVVVLAIGH